MSNFLAIKPGGTLVTIGVQKFKKYACVLRLEMTRLLMEDFEDKI